MTDQPLESLLDWLCPQSINYDSDQQIHANQRTQNTGIWIFDEPFYKEWLAQGGSFLWIKGESRSLFALG